MARILTALPALLLALLLAPHMALAQAPRPGPTVRTVAVTTDTVLNTDCGNIVQYSSASAVAVTLPEAGSGGNFNPRCQITLANRGAGNVTVTPTTSQIDGRASVVLQQGGGVSVVSAGGQWVSTGLFPALATTNQVDPDNLPPATAGARGAVRPGTCLEMGGTGNQVMSLTAACRTRTYNIIVDGGGSVITTGAKPAFEIGSACTITAWRVVGDQSGSIVVDIKKATYSGVATFSSIAASAKPTLSSAQKAENTSLTGWTTALAAGDWVQPVVDSVTTLTYATVSITCVE